MSYIIFWDDEKQRYAWYYQDIETGTCGPINWLSHRVTKELAEQHLLSFGIKKENIVFEETQRKEEKTNEN